MAMANGRGRREARGRSLLEEVRKMSINGLWKDEGRVLVK